ncbi:MAG: GIY-YIG nuclease family protein [Bacteroidia bacterium]|nr:GIY-YIG nuclease family protein [Bacteroidia bacterium]
MYTVYVLKSLDFDAIYIGFTSDMELRLISHNHPQNRGWTKRFMPWKIVYSETYPTKSAAMNREKQLKSQQGRKFIRETILKDNL